MDIETINPHPSLSKYIDFYYFIKADSSAFKSTHYSFPHTINVISIYENASYKSSGNDILVYEDQHRSHLTLLQSKRQQPIKVELKGKTNRISIFFKPLGINHFMKDSLATIMTEASNEFNVWNEQNSYSTYLKNCFAETDNQKKIDVLEQFLLSSFYNFDTSYINKAIDLLSDFEKDHTIEQISQEINIPLRTFNRHFKAVIGVSPIEHRNIVRFRHSLNNKLFDSQFKKLTDIWYDSNFYDQSNFIKMYKKLTGLNPKAFFGEVKKLGNNQLIFRIINNQ